MLLNLGLTADAAAAHSTDSSPQPETDPSSPPYSPASSSTCYSGFSLPALPFLNTLYTSKQIHGPTQSSGSASAPAMMSPVAATFQAGESSQTPTATATPTPTPTPTPPPTLARPRVSSHANRRSTRPKTSYQLAHPAAHARHKRLRLRPKLLLQLQQVSQTSRPLPILDILPSTIYNSRLAGKFPALFRGRNGLGPNDLVIIMSELYERTVSSIPETAPRSEDHSHDHREVVATICQMLQEDARLKGKAEICLNFGPVWEATPLPSGSYEFVANTDNGLRVMRWALRAGKSRRMSSVNPASQTREEGKRFTFSVIDPQTRRHPVIASMTRNQMEIFDEYSAVARSNTGPTTPTSAMSVISDLSDTEAPIEPHDVIVLDDELRTLIIITGIWVAFREGWSPNFSYRDPLSGPNGKSIVSPASSRNSSPTVAKAENRALGGEDDLSPMKEITNNGKRCMSVSSVRRSNTTAPAEKDTSFGSLSKRSNSTGAAFMERAKQRTASGISTRLNRHSMFTAGENGREVVVSRPASLRQSSFDPDDTQRPDRSHAKHNHRNATENTKPTAGPDRATVDRHSTAFPESWNDHEKDIENIKTKRRHRFSSLFTIFHRKATAH